MVARALVAAGSVRGGGIALELDGADRARPLVLSVMHESRACTLRLSLEEARALFDALAESITLATVADGARHAAGVDTPDADQPSTV